MDLAKEFVRLFKDIKYNKTQNDLVEAFQLQQLELVVAEHRNVSSQLLYQMGKIIGKGIVIIYDYYFHFCQC